MSVVVKGLPEAKAKLQLMLKQVRAEERSDIRAAGNALAKGYKRRIKSARTRQRGVKVSVSVTNTRSQADVGVNRYGMFEELGTRAHEITPRGARQVSFQSRRGRSVSFNSRASGKRVLASASQVYGTRVRHPGSPARPFMEEALRESEDEILEAYMRGKRRRLEAL